MQHPGCERPFCLAPAAWVAFFGDRPASGPWLIQPIPGLNAMNAINVLLLSQSDIIGLKLAPATVVSVVEDALREHVAGTYEMHPKIGVHPTGTDPANFIHAMPAYLHKMGVCGLKWVGGFVKNHKRGLPNVTGLQVCNDIETGVPFAIMDCSYLTGLRTAAVSSIAARLCARPDATTLALVGCGFEGAMHLRFLTATLPGIREVRLRDIREDAMKELHERAGEYFDGTIRTCQDNETCLTGADVVSTCTNGDEPVVHAAWLRPGVFCVGIEGGCAYTAEALHQAEKFLVDDVPLARYFDQISQGRLTEDGRPDPEFPGGLPAIHATIGEILAGKKPGRESAIERMIATPIGMSICDVALAHLAYRTAEQRGVGQRFHLV
jgi:ornithine cyclodeaminase/alanine dehydrogenase-like protein (mu-crystallin family)